MSVLPLLLWATFWLLVATRQIRAQANDTGHHSMTIQPCSYHLLVRIVDSRKPESGLVLPENIKPMQPHGLVISAGPDVKLVGLHAKVMFLPDNGIVVDEAEKLWIIPESCVFAVLVGEEEEANGRN